MSPTPDETRVRLAELLRAADADIPERPIAPGRPITLALRAIRIRAFLLVAAAVALSVVLTATAVVAEDRIRRDDDVSPTPSAASPTPSESPSPSDPTLPVPTVDIEDGPDSLTNQDTATFVFSVSPADAVAKCRLDGVDVTPCESPLRLSGLLEDTHLFEVRGINADGNAGEWTDHRWSIDLTPPTVTFASVTLDYGNRGVECRVDEQLWNCAETVTDLSGPHTFEAEYFSGSNSTSYIWRLDETPARVSFSDGPALAGEAAIWIEFDAGSDAAVCTVQAATEPCGELYRWPEDTTDGTDVLEKLEVVATDVVGNVSEPAVFSWSFTAFSTVG